MCQNSNISTSHYSVPKFLINFFYICCIFVAAFFTNSKLHIFRWYSLRKRAYVPSFMRLSQAINHNVKHFHHPRKLPWAFLQFISSTPLATTRQLSVMADLHFLGFYTNEKKAYTVSFFVRLYSPSVRTLRFIHVIMCIRSWSLFIAE